jgi:hypothetical protein
MTRWVSPRWPPSKAGYERQHRERLQCRRGCSACCVDDLTVFEIEATRIRHAFPELLANGEPRAPGACAFLDEHGACRVYAARPYVCRTQGLPLRWIDDDDDGALVERRDICELNDPGPALVELKAEQCWTIGPAEAKLATLQQQHFGDLERVGLRALFEHDG